MSLGQRIQTLRKEAGLSQEALGEALGVSRQAVSKWEGDGGVPELDTLIAMSRLFGVSLGQLLGVEQPAADTEEPAQTNTTASGVTKEQVEAILRRYTEESRKQSQLSEQKKRRDALFAICAVILVLGFFVLRFGERLSTMSNKISNLSNRIDNVELRVDYSISNLGNSIREILNEQENLISTEEIRVVDFDAKAEMVTVEVRVALKTYTPGTQAQFSLSWTTVDGTEGQTLSDWVEGPEFVARVTIPMNHQLSPVVRLRAADGVVQEQAMQTQYSGMHPDNFTLQAYNLFKSFSFHVGNYATVIPDSPEGENVAVVIYTGLPELFYPISAELIAERNGEEFLRAPLSLKKSKEPTEYYGCMENYGTQLRLEIGDEVIVRLEMEDNLGRKFEVTEGRYATKNGMQSKPLAAPLSKS